MVDPTLYSDLEARGIIKQVTDPALESALKNQSLTLYCGFDPTSDSLHVGSLLPLMTLRRFQLAGHRVIAVVGGATGMIGDPSGKSQERTLMGDAQITRNIVGIQKVISRFLDFSGDHGVPAVKLMNNGDWFRGLDYIAFLRDIGKHFTVNHMVAKESVRARLEDREHGISYTEFSYMLLQAYDFLHLHEKENCGLQVGGSEQWGNITAGIELIRRVRASRGEGESTIRVFGLTHPLISKADGTKFGKSESGTLWLDPARTSPYELYQFFIQTPDTDAIPFLKYFTFIPIERIRELEESLRVEPEKRAAQLALAREMMRVVHGEDELVRAEKASQALFGTSIRELDEKSLLDLLQGAPSTSKDRSGLQTPLALIELLVETGLCPSKGAARKDIAMGGINLNNVRVMDAAATVSSADLIAGSYLVLRKGKKSYHLVRFR